MEHENSFMFENSTFMRKPSKKSVLLGYSNEEIEILLKKVKWNYFY